MGTSQQCDTSARVWYNRGRVTGTGLCRGHEKKETKTRINLDTRYQDDTLYAPIQQTGKLRLQKWFDAYQEKSKKKITRELISTILTRKPKMSSFIEWQDMKIVYKRYASLYFCASIDTSDNELLTLEIIHRYVELLDKYFGSVCELDIIFNYEKAYFMLDELLIGGEIQETSKKNVLKAIAAQDLLQDEETPQGFLEDAGLG